MQQAWKAETEDLHFCQVAPVASVVRILHGWSLGSGTPGYMEVFFFEAPQTKASPSSGHSGPIYMLCLAQTVLPDLSPRCFSREPGPEHKALLLSMLVQTPRYPGPSLPLELETVPHGAFPSSGPAEYPGSTHENF